MDWKVRKNMAAGRGERGTEILHFRHAFSWSFRLHHEPDQYRPAQDGFCSPKLQLAAGFPNPAIECSLPENERDGDVIEREKKSEAELRKFIDERGTDIAAIIIEPIQGEGGGQSFPWRMAAEVAAGFAMRATPVDFRTKCKPGFALTGARGGCQHFNVPPDLLAFGKKKSTGLRR